MTTLHGGDIVIHKIEGKHTQIGDITSGPLTELQLSYSWFWTIIKIRQLVQLKISPKVQRQGLCLLSLFLGKPDSEARVLCYSLVKEAEFSIPLH